MLTMARVQTFRRRGLGAEDNCPVGQYFDDDVNACVSMCPTGTTYNPDTLLCVPTPTTAAPSSAADTPIYKKPWFIGGVAGALLLGIGVGIVAAR